ncbi:MAG TPA: hypothetical protein VM432_06230 [Bdellovibrionales bacterium]|nr:hypothetical protein [Bdellovibrionales bacterium]
MKFQFLCGLLLIGPALPSAAFAAGGVDGGGGGSITCTIPDADSGQVIRTVENGEVVYRYVRTGQVYQSLMTNGRDFQFLDLWEAETGFGPFFLNQIDIPYNEDSVDTQVDRAMKRLVEVLPELGKKSEIALAHIRKNILPLPDGVVVDEPRDTRIRFKPKECKVVGFALYSDEDDNLAIDPSMKKLVTKTDFAALFIHEAIYKVLRNEQNEQDSWRTRRIVAFLFSNEKLDPKILLDGFPKP